MPTYSVSPDLAAAVTDGTVRQVIQSAVHADGTTATAPRVGRTAHVRAGVGTGSKKLGSFGIVRVREVGVSAAGSVILSDAGDAASIRQLTDAEADTFAASLGHADREALLEALQGRLPFVGHLVTWDPS